MLDLRPILLANGILLGMLSLVMLIPMLLDLFSGNEDWKAFAESSFITAATGGLLVFANRGKHGTLSLRQAFLFTSFSYYFITFFASLPLYLGELDISMTDAYFEMASGLTTTGSTVLVGLDTMPAGILLWRALSNLIGGIGIVVLTLAILPMLQIGGMQLFKTESSDTSEKILPHIKHIAGAITTVILVLVLICTICYWLAGMNGFDALCHAMATVATGGFSTYDASFAQFKNPSIHWIAILFMIAGSAPLILFYQSLTGKPFAIFKNGQVQWFVSIIAFATALLSLWLIIVQDAEPMTAIRESAFSVTSVLSTTGFVTADYAHWGSFATCVFYMLLAIGGCTGSTSGGIKMFRLQILYQTVNTQMARLIHPHGVFIARYNGKAIPDNVATSVTTFIVLFGVTFTVLAVLLSLFGLDFTTSISGALQALANVGPGLGDIIGPVGNFSTLPDGAKWVLSIAMIMGRLELLTVLVLFSSHFWRD
jgi:trk system potassium uptake protein TrkH